MRACVSGCVGGKGVSVRPFPTEPWALAPRYLPLADPHPHLCTAAPSPLRPPFPFLSAGVLSMTMEVFRWIHTRPHFHLSHGWPPSCLTCSARNTVKLVNMPVVCPTVWQVLAYDTLAGDNSVSAQPSTAMSWGGGSRAAGRVRGAGVSVRSGGKRALTQNLPPQKACQSSRHVSCSRAPAP